MSILAAIIKRVKSTRQLHMSDDHRDQQKEGQDRCDRNDVAAAFRKEWSPDQRECKRATPPTSIARQAY